MKEGELFPDVTIPQAKDSLDVAVDTEHAIRVRRSSLWAAYGDALGWISELTDEAGLKRRTGGVALSEPVTWNRRIGGRTGITASLPKGCYSDDSQLRLATSRAIRSDGFDVEAFAKVELPVWLSYALGGGKSTSAAAMRFAKTKSSWFANTFKGWTQSGGNGAAMRVQPHVWAVRTPDEPASFLPDVVRNTICTHSHPTGIMGAVLHALCVARAIYTGNCPSPSDLDTVIEVVEPLPEILGRDTELSYWCSAFEREYGSFSDAWENEIMVTRDAVKTVKMITTNVTAEERYKNIVNGLRLRDPARRGGGMLTAVAATALTWCETCPSEAIRIAANAVGTDTDTIATMAGAIIGAASESDPPVDVLDADLFRSEAHRLVMIASGGNPTSHSYPDLLYWSAPMTRADALVRSKDGRLTVRGMGSVSKTIDEPIEPLTGDFQWQWIKLGFGQTLLIKRRRSLAFDVTQEVTGRRNIVIGQPIDFEKGNQRISCTQKHEKQSTSDSPTVDPHQKTPRESSQMTDQPQTLNLPTVLSYVEEYIDNDEGVGRMLRQVVCEGTPGEIHEFVGKLIDLLRQTRMGSTDRPNTRGVSSSI